MVGHTLHVGENVQQHDTGVDGAFALFQTLNVLIADGGCHLVHYLLQRLDALGQVSIIVIEGVHRHGQNLLDGGVQLIQLALSSFRECRLALQRVYDVGRMVANTLQIADGVQQLRNLTAVGGGQFAQGQTHQIGTQFILVGVQLVFLLGYLLHHGGIVMSCQRHSLH